MSEPLLFDLSKENALLQLLQQGMTMIHLDPRAQDVVVPAHLANQPVLRLNLSYAFNIPDFNVDEWGISITLHFPNVGNVLCKVPWDALFGVTSQVTKDGRMWPESMPIELRRELAQRQVLLLAQARGKAPLVDLSSPGPKELGRGDGAPSQGGAEAKAPSFKVIQGGSTEPPPSGDDETSDAPKASSEKAKGPRHLSIAEASPIEEAAAPSEAAPEETPPEASSEDEPPEEPTPPPKRSHLTLVK